MQQIEAGKLYTLSNTSTIDEMVRVLHVDNSSVQFEYYVQDEFTVKVWGRKRTLPLKTFCLCYRLNTVANLLYTGD